MLTVSVSVIFDLVNVELELLFVFVGLFSKCEGSRIPVRDSTQPPPQHQTIWKNPLHAQVSKLGQKRHPIPLVQGRAPITVY